MVRRTALSRTSNESNLISGLSQSDPALISVPVIGPTLNNAASDVRSGSIQSIARFMELKCGFWSIPLSWITAESKSHFDDWLWLFTTRQQFTLRSLAPPTKR